MSDEDDSVMALSPRKREKTGGREAGTPNKQARFELASSAKVYGLRALATVVEIMEDESEAGATRLAAAKEILDRGFGKAKQITEISGLDGDDIRQKLTIEFIGQPPITANVEASFVVTEQMKQQVTERNMGDVVQVQAQTVRVPEFRRPWEPA